LKIKFLSKILHPYECSICDSFFGSRGDLKKKPKVRMNCPHCGAYPRHRFLWLYLNEHTDLIRENYRVLHTSPFRALKEKFKSQTNLDYLTSAMDHKGEDLNIDLTQIDQADHSFDVVICSHVLEHIQDDRKAMSEIYRILKPGGFAIFMFPIKGELTHEDASIVSSDDRKKYFSQEDHVRVYGTDVYLRLENVGFDVVCAQPQSCFSAAQIRKHNLFKTQRLYHCKKKNF
jgi:SAM-dependent methyltransferase